MAIASISAMTAGAVMALARPAHVVRRPNGQVVVILVGRDSASEAEHWRAKGYRVEPIDGGLLGI